MLNYILGKKAISVFHHLPLRWPPTTTVEEQNHGKFLEKDAQLHRVCLVPVFAYVPMGVGKKKENIQKNHETFPKPLIFCLRGPSLSYTAISWALGVPQSGG